MRLSERHLREANKEDVRVVFDAAPILNSAKRLRQIHNFHKRGWTNDREKSMKRVAAFDIRYLFHPEYGKYFDPRIPKEDRAKEIDNFLKRKKNEGADFTV